MKKVADICAMRWLYGGLGNLFQLTRLSLPSARNQVFETTFDTAAKHLGILGVVTLCLVWLALWAPEEIALRKGGQT